MVYRAMLDRLNYDPDDRDGPANARRQLDRTLQVDAWQLPGSTRRINRRVVAASRTPAWWHGEEDASQTFLTAMGVMT